MLEKREERIEYQKDKFNRFFKGMIKELHDLQLADGVDKNSWIYAGCIQDLEKARTRILAYIERCLK